MMERIVSILLYLLIFATSTALIYQGASAFPKKKKLGILLITLGILAPSIMAGIRYKVGVDFSAYMEMFNNVKAGRPMYFRAIEPLSTLIIIISAYLHNSFLMFFSFSLITNLCFFLAFWRFFKKDKKRVALAFLFYLCILFPTTLNAVRSGVATSMVALWFIGDTCKLNYNIKYKTPIQMIISGGSQIFLDFFCLMQIFCYKDKKKLNEKEVRNVEININAKSKQVQ